jgi:peptidase M28-like protein
VRAPLLAALLLAPLLAGCGTPPPERPPTNVGHSEEGRNTTILAAARAFDGGRAWESVRAQVERQVNAGCLELQAEAPARGDCPGPRYRVTGTEGNNETARYISETMEALGWLVRRDNFSARFEGRPLPAHNVVAERHGAENGTFYVIAHYDSRPCADEDPVAANRTQPVLGANDGGSGVAVMLELARHLQEPMSLTLRFVFVDAEDMGDSGHGCGRGTAWAQGSTHYARGLSADEVRQARGLVLLDLVGGHDLTIRREARSNQQPNRALLDDVYAWAERLNATQFLDEPGPAIEDDHVPFAMRGIPSIDLIHLDNEGRDVFPDSHHTTYDDLAHVSPRSLEAVGEVVLAALLAWDAEAG